MDLKVDSEWFANLCLLLNSNPMSATETILKFRDADNAFGACHYFLSCSELSEDARFQAVLIIQYIILKKWDSISILIIENLKNVVYSIILENHSFGKLQNSASAFNNKLMQLYALCWKHNWQSLESDGQEQYLLQVFWIEFRMFCGVT
jgi:hypothetical protein